MWLTEKYDSDWVLWLIIVMNYYSLKDVASGKSLKKTMEKHLFHPFSMDTLTIDDHLQLLCSITRG